MTHKTLPHHEVRRPRYNPNKSHDLRTGKQPSRFFVPAPVGQLCVDQGVLNVLMAEPVLDEHDVRPRIQQMRGDRVLQYVEVALSLGEPGPLPVLLHQLVEGLAADGGPLSGGEEDGRLVLAGAQIPPEVLGHFRAEGVLAGDQALQAIYADLQALEVHVVPAQEPHLRGPQAVGVREPEEGLVTLVLD